jgi:tRNA dimethylallyltransferase
MLGLTMNRSLLYQRIEERVDCMFERGLVEETERLLEKGLRANRTAMQAIGYKEVVAYLDGECSLEEAKKLLKRNSRRYAKRQLTWFRKDDRIQWYNVEDYATRQELYECLLEGLRGMTKTTQGQSLHPQ